MLSPPLLILGSLHAWFLTYETNHIRISNDFTTDDRRPKTMQGQSLRQKHPKGQPAGNRSRESTAKGYIYLVKVTLVPEPGSSSGPLVLVLPALVKTIEPGWFREP